MVAEPPANEDARRLWKQNVKLRAQLDAFERSRWWRLHPGFAWRRMIGKLTVQTARSRKRADTTAERPPDECVKRFRAEVMASGSFTQDWFTGSIPDWHPMVTELERRQARILEIGSFEGLSTCYLLWRLPDASVTCVDPFTGSAEHGYLDLDPRRLEMTFDRNVALVDASRTRKIVGDSKRVLLDLVAEGARFDFVYIDGSHVALDVIVDAALSWQLLETGGYMVFDDYTWAALGPDPLLRPASAIDTFVQMIDGKHDITLKTRQLGLRKTAV
jgi:predicted O-methyltransferase YrrM